jgi:hypothetical protein
LAGDVIIPINTNHWHTAPHFHTWVRANIRVALPGMNTTEHVVEDAGGDVTLQLMLGCSGMIPRDASGADVCKLGRSYVNGKQPGPSPFAEYREWRHEGTDTQTLRQFEAKPLEIIIVYLRTTPVKTAPTPTPMGGRTHETSPGVAAEITRLNELNKVRSSQFLRGTGGPYRGSAPRPAADETVGFVTTVEPQSWGGGVKGMNGVEGIVPLQPETQV